MFIAGKGGLALSGYIKVYMRNGEKTSALILFKGKGKLL